MTVSKNFFSYFILSFILLTIFHFESREISGVKISHIWKGAVLVFIFLTTLKKNLKFFIYKPYIIIAVIQLFHITSSTNFSPQYLILLLHFSFH